MYRHNDNYIFKYVYNIMKKRITREEAAKRMAAITQRHLDSLPLKEKEKRVKAFKKIINEVSGESSSCRIDTPSRSKQAHGRLSSRAHARGL